MKKGFAPEAVDSRENIANQSWLELIRKMRQCSEEGSEGDGIRFGLDPISEGTWQGAILKEKESNQSSLPGQLMEWMQLQKGLAIDHRRGGIKILTAFFSSISFLIVQ